LKEARELQEHEAERKRLLKGMMRGDISLKQLACDPPKNGKERLKKLTPKQKKIAAAKLTHNSTRKLTPKKVVSKASKPTKSTKGEAMQCD
jgi:hypothetical protein